MKYTKEIDNVLQIYLPDDYYEEIRHKLIPVVQQLIDAKVSEQEKEIEAIIKRRNKAYAELDQEREKVSEQSQRIQFLEQQLSPLAKKWDDLNNDLIKQLGRKDARSAQLEEALRELEPFAKEVIARQKNEDVFGYNGQMLKLSSLKKVVEALLTPKP